MSIIKKSRSISVRIPDNDTAHEARQAESWSIASQPSSMSSSAEYVRRPSDPISIPSQPSSRSSAAISPVSPMTPTVCPNCGLRRRSSLISIVEAGGSPPSGLSFYTSAQSSKSMVGHHWPTDQCCGNWCPDTVRPQAVYRSSDAGSHSTERSASEGRKRHHRRRRSSLCHWESFADEAEDDFKGGCDEDLMVDKQIGTEVAEKIAQKVIQRSRRSSLDVSYFDKSYYQ